ncbi:PAS domain S-box protein [Variovorax sp. YR752]|uniref:PAS domain S-box protein n=1 Tax=Variovorax sp. YR752 TaxID=1884383 RepID=UPI003137E403
MPDPTAETAQADPGTATERRARRDWVLLALGLLLAALLMAWGRVAAHRAVLAQEQARLEVQARAVDSNLSRQLIGAWRALESVREDRHYLLANELADRRASRRLQALTDAMPGVRSFALVDADGVVRAANRADLLGADFSRRESFTAARAGADLQRLYLSRPYRGSQGVFSMSLTLVLPSADGGFGGVATATLDPDYFQVALHSVLYAPDMWAAIAHADGPVLLYEPPNDAATGSDLNRPGSFFRRHLDSGAPATVLRGTPLVGTGGERMVAQRTVAPSAVPLDKPLVIAVSREEAALFTVWRHQTLLYAGAFVLLGVALAAALAAMQRGQRVAMRQAAEREAVRRAGAERLALALRGADLGLWDLDVGSGHATVDERWNAMLGLAHEPLDPDSEAWRTRVHPDDWPAVSAAQQAHLAGRTERFEAVYRMRHADGHWVWILDRGRVLERAADGSPLRMVGTHMDISERMQAQRALERSERSLAITLHSIGDAVIATDPQGVVERLNAVAERLTGWPAQEAVGQPLASVFRILDAHTRSPAVDPVQMVLSCGEIVGLASDTLLVSRDGREYLIADSAAPIRDDEGRIAGVVLTFSDATSRFRAEQALRANEHRLRTLLDNLQSGVVVHGPDTRIEQANAAACRILGLSIEQLRGMSAVDPYWALFDEDGAPLPPQSFPVQQVLTRREPVRNLLVGIRCVAQERPVWGLCNAFPLYDDAGELLQVVVTIADITERKEAEQRLVAAQAELTATLQAVPDLLFDVDAEGRFHGFHSPRHDLLYAPPEAFIGRCVADVVPADAAAVVARALQQAGETGRSIGLQYEMVLPQGSRWFELSVSRKPQAAGALPRFIVLARDISERRRAEIERQKLEQQLREAQKMESIGTLAGGIAHDFNNILAAILGNVALAREDAAGATPVLTSLDQINRAALRARHLVQQILAFSRREQHGLTVQPLRPVMEEALGLLRATLPAGVQLDALLPETPLQVRADATQLQQVLINLCTNAWHALPEQGGRIEVGCERIVLDEALRQRQPELASGAYAHLWVSDNGAGMDAATRERIFDPFFTTKPVGRGTGLGLSVVHGIVRAHEGSIAVDTAPGRGSTFHLYIPSPESGTGNHDVHPALGADVRGSGQRVLYIDDDEVMVVMVERLLERGGFTVVAESDAAAAVQRLQADPDAFDAVVTDFNMPGMSGLEVARIVAGLRPALPVVISTGYLSEELRAQALALGVRGLLKKENTLEELAGLLRELIAPR